MKSLALTKPLEVDIELADAVPTDAETEVDFEALMDVQKVSAKDVKRLKALGLHVKRQGILETQRGALLVNQAWLLGITNDIARLIRAKNKAEPGKDVPTEEICKLGDLFSKLIGKSVELSTVMMAQEPKEPNGQEQPPAPNTAFPAGAVVGLHAHTHYHQPPPPEKPVATPPSEP